jgi:tripartite ATP-independent transporter DctP family solute receptor
MVSSFRMKQVWIAVALLICLSLAGGTGAGAATARAAATKRVSMAYNGPASEEKNAVHLFAATFKEYVEGRTNGRVQIVLYPDSQLGNEDERMELVNDGLLQINVASYAGMAPIIPELFAASIPFLFDSYKAAHKFFDEGEYWRRVQALFQKKTGSLLLEAVEEGEFLAFTNSKRELRSPKDFAGLKFRAMDSSQAALYRSFGASSAPIPWTEVYMALQTGVADGQMNPPMYIIIGSLYEVQKYMTLANIQYSDQFLVVNGDWFHSLSKEDQEIVRRAAHDANIITRTDVEARGEERVNFIADRGVKVYSPTAVEMNEFRQIGQSSYIAWLKGQIGHEWIDAALKDAAWANKEVKK